MAVTVKGPIFCDVTLYNVEFHRDNVLQASLLCLYFGLEDGDKTFLRNVGEPAAAYTHNTSEDSTLHSHVNSEFAH
jgi:hypothetical protein